MIGIKQTRAQQFVVSVSEGIVANQNIGIKGSVFKISMIPKKLTQAF